MAMPVIQQFGVDAIAPPIVAAVGWLLMRGWAGVVEGGNVRESTKLRQSKEFWALLILFYLLMFGGTIYYNFIGKPPAI